MSMNDSVITTSQAVSSLVFQIRDILRRILIWILRFSGVASKMPLTSFSSLFA